MDILSTNLATQTKSVCLFLFVKTTSKLIVEHSVIIVIIRRGSRSLENRAQNLAISLSFFAEDGKEMHQELLRTCTVI